MDEATKLRVEEFLSKNIYPKDLAKYLRRFKLEAIKLVLNTRDDQYRNDWIADGFYFLNELCEILDPQLEDEEL